MDATAIITEQRTSYQGTGRLIGTRQNFVRFAGCSIGRCPIRSFCDEPFSLTRVNGGARDVYRIVEIAVGEVGPGGWIHITGGEPLDQPEVLERLVVLAQAEGLRVHLQTSGSAAVPVPIDWLTVSPKAPATRLIQDRGHELVVVYDGQPIDELLDYRAHTEFDHYFLVPKWIPEHRRDGDAATNASEVVRVLDQLNTTFRVSGGAQWMLTLQAHKYLKVY